MTDRPVDLIDSLAEVAIRFDPLPDSELLQRPLDQTAWRLVATPDDLGRAGWSERPEDLSRLAQVRFTAPQHINTLRFDGPEPPVVVAASVCAENGEAVRSFILGGMGIARPSNFMVAEDIATGHLVPLFTDHLGAAPLAITGL
ncbi:MAG: hypothetical protein CML68_11545 [Rhodobacteraceae bacterium]|nr:hypothetical protein [Paracoccaceae bacterium]